MSEENYSQMQYYSGVIMGVAMCMDPALRNDLIGIAVGLANLADKIKQEGE